MRQNYVKDFISGKNVVASPEEVEAVQVFSRLLVEEYGYLKTQIQTHPQWRVKARPSDTKKEYPIDIAVFSDNEKTDDTLHIIVECKRKTKHDGLIQLRDYLRFSNAKLGVWFNGEERVYIRKHEKNGEIHFPVIPNIPRKGERLEDIGRFKRKDLIVPHNLKIIFKTIRSHLAGNTVGATRDEIFAEQLINIVFCKIYDERFTKPGDMVSFRAGVDEDIADVAERIKALFDNVKSKYNEVIDISEKINLDDKSISYIVGELQNYCIIDSERDAIADAFEIFIGDTLKGGQGQFFTPKNIVRLMVEIINPTPEDLIIDPACGSGGFLVESLKFVWAQLESQGKEYNWSDLAVNDEKNAVAIKNIRGIEKDEFLGKVAKAYMAIIGDGKGAICCDDALDTPFTWKKKTRQFVDLEKFDIVLTNPPFGKDIKVVGREKLAQYDLASKWKKDGDKYDMTDVKRTEMRPEVLFIERCMQLLKPHGTMGIILPETFFHAPKMGYVMQFMAGHNIKWVIDLPHNTFRPHNNAKCIAVIMQKDAPQQQNISFAVAEEMGHDHHGNEIYRWDSKTQTIDKNNLWDDIQLITDEHRTGMRNYIFQSASDMVAEKKIFVPRYYWKTKGREIQQIADEKELKLIPIQQLIDEGVITFFDGHGSPEAEYKGRGEFPYVRVKDVVNWEIYKDPTSCVPKAVYLKMRSDSKELETEDVLYVRRGSYRIGSVAMVSPFDHNVILTREILVLRVAKENKYGLTPHYLLYLLSHRLVAMQAFNKILIETTLPNISNRWKELNLPFFKNGRKRKSLITEIENVISAKWSAVERLNKIKEQHGEIIT